MNRKSSRNIPAAAIKYSGALETTTFTVSPLGPKRGAVRSSVGRWVGALVSWQLTEL